MYEVCLPEFLFYCESLPVMTNFDFEGAHALL